MLDFTTPTTLFGELGVTNLSISANLAPPEQKLAAPPLRVYLEADAALGLKPSYFAPISRDVNPVLSQNILYALYGDAPIDNCPPWLDSEPLYRSGIPEEHLFGAFVSHNGLRLVFANPQTRKFYEYRLQAAKNADVKITFITMEGKKYIYEEHVNRRTANARGLFAFLQAILPTEPQRIIQLTQLATASPTGPRREFYPTIPSSPNDSSDTSSLLIKEYC